MRSKRIKLAAWALSLVVAAALFALTGCCSQSASGSAAGPYDARRAASANRATPIFNPAIALTAPQPAEPMPPMEAFNWRPVWPAAGGVPLGEITVYREYYNDWQRSSTAGRGYVNDYLHRSFASYRTGVIIR